MREILLVLAIYLGACSAIVPDTLLMLQDVDPLTVDPADIALQIDPQDGGRAARLRGVDSVGAASRWCGALAVELVGDVLHIVPDAHADLRKVRAEIRAWEAADPGGTEGSPAFHFDPCRVSDSAPSDTVVSVSIRLDADGPFLPPPLVREGPFTDVLDQGTRSRMQQCI